MSGLTEQDREDLAGAIDGWPQPGGRTETAVEAIIARHVRAALTEAAEEIEAEFNRRLLQRSPGAHLAALPDAARIVRNLTPDG